MTLLDVLLFPLTVVACLSFALGNWLVRFSFREIPSVRHDPAEYHFRRKLRTLFRCGGLSLFGAGTLMAVFLAWMIYKVDNPRVEQHIGKHSIKIGPTYRLDAVPEQAIESGTTNRLVPVAKHRDEIGPRRPPEPIRIAEDGWRPSRRRSVFGMGQETNQTIRGQNQRR